MTKETVLHIVCYVTTLVVLCYVTHSRAEVGGLDDVRQYLRSIRSNKARNTSPDTMDDDRKLSDLLMKSIRFRDLDEQDYPDQVRYDVSNGVDLGIMPVDFSPYTNYNNQPQVPFIGAEKRGGDASSLAQLFNSLKSRNGVGKRQQVSVTQLAQLLHDLKTRNADDSEGVKLNGLRFGKRK